jgi:hydantoinase/carbamoylase family amidase
VAAAPRVADALDDERLLGRLRTLAEIGADPGGGVTRIAFSDEEERANDLVISWVEELGLTVAADGFGNLFASTDGNAEDGRPFLAGSHVDTVPHGGRLDGALGVVAAIEAIAAIQACDGLPAWPLELVVWRCEEPVRFAHGKVGSLLFTGLIGRDDLRPLSDDVDLSRPPASRSLPARRASRGIAGCLELHIEQGRRLERGGHRLGVVTAVASPIRLRARFEGRSDHSGATPMDDRRDAACAAAELTLAVERAGGEEACCETVATTTRITVSPGAMNVVPGGAELLIDVRGIDGESMRRLVERLRTEAGRIAGAREVAITIDTLSSAEPTRFDPGVIDALDRTVRELGETPVLMPSGAGHDAQCVASLAPAGMLFVPSVAGISHSPLEQTDDRDIVLGARALAAAWATIGGER